MNAFGQAGPDMIFHAQLDEHVAYANVWGYNAPNGQSYALLGATTGLAVINVSDPQNPYEAGFISGPTSSWREIRTYSHYAYVTNETGGGLMIVNLADPENPVAMPSYNGFTTGHSIHVDTATARAFIHGSDLGNGGIRILSLANPAVPVEIGSWEQRYVHDSYVFGNRLYAACIFDGRLDILNLTTVPPPATPLATIQNYPNAFTHNCWTTPDGLAVMTTDETNGSEVRLWNVENLPMTPQMDSYRATPVEVIPHNVHIEGTLAFLSHYTLGVKVLDITNRFNIQEVSSYDTYPQNNGGTFDGCWGVYPYFTANPNLLVASDITGGLFVLEYEANSGAVAGEVTWSGNPATKIAGATVEVVQTEISTTTNGNGQYIFQHEAGSYDMEVSAYGYVTKTVPITVVANDTSNVNVALDRVPGGSIQGIVRNANTLAPITGAKVEVFTTPLVATTPASGLYAFPIVPSGEYTVKATVFGFDAMVANVEVVNGSTNTINFSLTPTSIVTTFESGVGSWTVSGNASSGVWALGDPFPTGGGTVQTGDDHTPPPGVNAWITGLPAGTSVGDWDVDSGSTILTSPIFNTVGMTNPRVSYWRWYVTGYTTNPNTDFWTVEISSNGGGSWIPIENTDVATPAWVNIDLDLNALVPQNGLTRFRFTARDTGQGSITEAGLDDFMIYSVVPYVPTVDAPSVATGPRMFELGPANPTPFRSGQTTTLSLSLPKAGPVSARVFDVAGRKVATLLDQTLDSGVHRIVWNGQVDSGVMAPAGVYFIRLDSPEGVRTQRTLLLR
jgi:choice-of-anchor B domain-containing protein